MGITLGLAVIHLYGLRKWVYAKSGMCCVRPRWIRVLAAASGGCGPRGLAKTVHPSVEAVGSSWAGDGIGIGRLSEPTAVRVSQSVWMIGRGGGQGWSLPWCG